MLTLIYLSKGYLSGGICPPPRGEGGSTCPRGYLIRDNCPGGRCMGVYVLRVSVNVQGVIS